MPPERLVSMLLLLIVLAGVVIAFTADDPLVAAGCYLLGLALGTLRIHLRQP